MTINDLYQSNAAAKATQATAQAARDFDAKQLSDAETALATQTLAAQSADATFAKAVATIGPVLIGAAVYEPTADGKYRSFVPASQDTVVPS